MGQTLGVGRILAIWPQDKGANGPTVPFRGQADAGGNSCPMPITGGIRYYCAPSEHPF